MGVTDGSGPARLAPGDPVRVQFRTWDGGLHWGSEVVWLGEDEHGWWTGWPQGTHWSRPGAEFMSWGAQVGLFPRDRGFAATFYEQVPGSGYEFRLYVDVATPPVLEAGELTSVDLDLDVIERFDGAVFVDDEDEFADNQTAYGYPAELVAHAEAECDRVLHELRSGAAHFGESLADHWRRELGRLLR